MALTELKLPGRFESAKECLDEPGRPRPSVLYVEDEIINWDVSEKTLRRRYALTRAVSSREVFELMSNHSFQAILMDIQLANSEMDGVEIVRTLKGIEGRRLPDYATGIERQKLPPIIFVTAYTGRYDRDELIAAGGDELISKPVDFTKLSLVLARCIARHVWADPVVESKIPSI